MGVERKVRTGREEHSTCVWLRLPCTFLKVACAFALHHSVCVVGGSYGATTIRKCTLRTMRVRVG